jgi:hypothetical protein
MMDFDKRLEFLSYNVWLRRQILLNEIEMVKISLCERDVIPNFSGEIDVARINYPIGLEVYY